MFNVKMSSSNTIQGGIFLNNKNKYKNKNIKLIEGNQNMYESLESPPNEKQVKRLVQEYRGLVDKYEMNYVILNYVILTYVTYIIYKLYISYVSFI